MPIHAEIGLKVVSDAEFERIDSVVMACAYAAHNKLGRLCDERVYEADLAARLRAEGFSEVVTQVAVTASFRDFERTYRLDLVVDGIVYELKAVEALAPIHDAQVYHYAALLELDRIKLLNFGAESVEGRMRRCPFGAMDRRQVVVDRRRWEPVSEGCSALAETAGDCFKDWGGFLEARLHEDVLIFLSGGESGCVRRLPVIRDKLMLGSHKVHCHGEDVGFVVTSHAATVTHERHLRSLLSLLPLHAWQWINIHNRSMQMITLINPIPPTNRKSLPIS